MPTYVSHSELTGGDLHDPKGLTYDNGNLSLGETYVLKVDSIAPVSPSAAIAMTKVTINELAGALDAGNYALTRINIDSGDISGVTISSGLTWSAAQNFNNVQMDNVNIQSGVINTGQTMSVADITASGLITTTAGLKDTSLTPGRIVLVDSDQTITDDSDLTFSVDTLTVPKIGAFQAAGSIDFNSQEMESINIISGNINTSGTLSSGDTTITGTFTANTTSTFTGYITATAGLKTNLIQNLDSETAIEIDADQKITIPNTLDVQTLILGDSSFSFVNNFTLSNPTTGRLDMIGDNGIRLTESDSSTSYANLSFNNGLSILSSDGNIRFNDGSITELSNLTVDTLNASAIILDAEITATATELNTLDGIESTTLELNQLHDSGITTSDLVKLVGSSYESTVAGKVPIYGESATLKALVSITDQTLIQNIGPSASPLTVNGPLDVSGNDYRVGGTSFITKVGSEIALKAITEISSDVETVIETAIDALPNLNVINGQDFLIEGSLAVESGSSVFLNQDLTTDALGVQFGNLQLGVMLLNHTSCAIGNTAGEPINLESDVTIEDTLKLNGNNKIFWNDADTNYIKGNDSEIVIDGGDYLKINANTQVHIGSDSSLTGSADAILLDGNVRVTGAFYVVGDTTHENETTLDVTNATISVNVGGAAGSGSEAGLLVEEDGSATGYFKTNTSRKGWDIKGPADAAVTTIETDSNVTILSTTASSGMRINDALNITGATDIDSTLNVDSNTDIAGYLKINTNKFTVASATGNTTAAGTMTIDGHTELNSTLNVDLAATFQDNFTINADNKMFKIQTNSDVDKFTVDTDNGNTDIQGTLNVVNAATLHDNVTINADDKTFTIELDNGTPKFTVASATGNTHMRGTLIADGHTDLNSSTTIDGATIINNGLNITADNKMFTIETSLGADKFTVDTDNGNTNIEGTLDVTGNVALDEDLIIGDAADDSVTSNSSTWSFPNTTSINLKDATVGALKFETDSLVFDTANDRIGINQSTPTRALDIVGGTTMTGDLHVGGNDITFGNGEYLSNSLDGTLRFNSNLRFDIDSDSSISFRTRDTDGVGSKLTIKSQDALNGDNNGGDIWIQAGAKSGSGTDGRIDIKSKSNIRDEMLFDSTKKLCWVGTNQYIEGNGSVLNLDAEDTLNIYSDSETLIDTQTLTIGAPTLVDIASVEVAISGDIDLEGDIYMQSGAGTGSIIYWGTDLSQPYIKGTNSGMIIDSNDTLVVNADTNTVWSSPLTELTAITSFQVTTALLDLDVGVLVDIDAPEVDISGSLDIEGDIDMATGKKITWVDDNQHITGTDSSITIESDNSFLVEADNDATINCNNLFYGVDGDDTSVINTFRGSTSDGVFRWRSTPLTGFVEGHFQFYDDIFMQDAEHIFFRDDQTSIYSSTSYQLDIKARNSGSGKIMLDADEVHLHTNSTFGGVFCDNWITFDNYNDGIAFVDSGKTIMGTTHNIQYNAGATSADQHLFRNRISIGDADSSHWGDAYGYKLNVKPGSNGNHITSGIEDFRQNYSVICSDAVVLID